MSRRYLHSRRKRALDLAVAVPLLTLSAPIVGLAALATLALLRRGGVYRAAAAAQAALVAAALSNRKAKPVLVARYYVLTTAALALGLYDWLRHGTQVGWEIAEGTR